jgi:STE24 endopeptidase
MSDTTATIIRTVSLVTKRPRSRVLPSLLLAVAAAEIGARLLAPRTAAIEPEPVELRSYFTAEEIERGARFARPQLALGLAQSALELLTLARLVRRPPRILRGGAGNPALLGAAAGAGMAVLVPLVPLPLAVVARKRAVDVGLATQSWRDWAGDLGKATAISAALAGAGGAGAVAATRRFPRGWWAPVALGSVAVGTLLAALAPAVLDPIFNDFTPLPEGETRSDVLELARAAGVEVGEVYSVDASRRTSAANAYVSGLGPTKRVVLFDTLLDRYSRDEVRLVVAHELAHVRHRDVPRSVLYAGIVAPAGALAVQRLSWTLSPERGSPAALAGIALAAALVAAPLGMLGNRLSRAIERRADQFSLELAGAPEAFVSFEQRIAVQNIADLEPPKWLTALIASHPPTIERIGAAVAFSRASGAA